jgi:hypothetical protein
MSNTCKRCGHESSTKSNLLKHLRRKTPCNAITDISIDDYIKELLHKTYNEKTWDCGHCGKQFNNYQNKWRHLKTCKSAVSEIDELRKRVDDLEKKGLSTNITNNNNNNTVNQQQNIHFHLRDFGHEDISYLSKEFLSSCFATKDLVRLIENMHCDRDHPENHNIRIKSQKRNQIETRENNRWLIKDEDDALTECIQNGYRVLVRHGFKNKDKIIQEELDDDEDEYHSIREWLESVYESRTEQKPIKRKLLLLFLNNQALILAKDEE